jgi:AMIN domain
MAALKNLCGVLALAWVVVPASAQAAHVTAVRGIAVVSQEPLQLQIQTSPAVVPQTQMISGPDRLVIDIPNTVPGATLRGIAVKRGEVKGVRVSQFSTTPPVTRIVVDLNMPQSYRIAPNSAGLLVSLGNDSERSANAPTIGWVSAKPGVKVASAPASPLVRKNLSHPAVSTNGVSVQFANGLLSIHATGATLSEVLFQIQKQTGAEIAIPSGTEQNRVAADFGPGPASEVLGELLTGSGLNFVIVGSETDPRALRSVILSRKSDAPAGPIAAPQAYAPAAAENMPQEDQEVLTPPDDNTAAPPQPVQQPADAGSPTPPPPQ